MKQIPIQDLNDIVGKKLEDANAYATSKGLILREVEIDGKAKMITCDLRHNRVNVATMNGKVTKICSVG